VVVFHRQLILGTACSSRSSCRCDLGPSPPHLRAACYGGSAGDDSVFCGSRYAI